MHTFFINTSKKELSGCDILFDIHFENKTLVSMDCPMADWYDKDKGYLSCVRKMSDMIDGYVELNNAFNLIIYIDLPEYKAYSSIERDEFHDMERDECCAAMHVLFTHVISETILKELSDYGRRPNDLLIMFGQEKKFITFSVPSDDPRRHAVMKKVFELIGLPGAEKIESIAKETERSDEADKVSAFKERVLKECREELVPALRSGYESLIDLWCDEVVNDNDISDADTALFDRINSINKVESERIGIEMVSCPYDHHACTVNKSVMAMSEMSIALYLLKCVEYGSVYESAGDDSREVLEFRSYTADEIVPVLKAKMDIYSNKVEQIESLAKSYSDLGLAPKLSAFDHEKFGLDMYGDKAFELVVNDVKPVDNGKGAGGKDNGNGSDDIDKNDGTIVIKGNDKELDIVEGGSKLLFSKEEYLPFDYNFEVGGDKMIKKNTTPEEYIEQAKRLRRHHLDYLKKLKLHVSHALSNYAGKSKENKPALLQVGGYRYAAPGEEKKVLEAVENVSEKAYDSIFDRYMEFCAGRSVAISDIEEQCNWFISRVGQIKESLKKIKLVAIGLLVAIIVLYIPFFVIQFEAITENILTLATALGSLAVPVLLLYFIFAAAALSQKRRYISAWKEFKERSDKALEENKIAVQKYDQLLSLVIPALRWVYEYKLDVDYCAECCSVADAKIEHHRRKLRERVASIRNMLSDLEYRETKKEEASQNKVDTEDAVDYNVSFCSGDKNRRFYSVIDLKELKKAKN